MIEFEIIIYFNGNASFDLLSLAYFYLTRFLSVLEVECLLCVVKQYKVQNVQYVHICIYP